MRISELSRRTDVAVPTFKFYLREGLLPPGELTSPTQASYDERHVERLRLIRALVTGVAMPITAVRRVLTLIDAPPGDVLSVFGEVQSLMTTPGDVALDGARQQVQRWGWHDVADFDVPLRELAKALAASDAAGFVIPDGILDRYAEAMHAVAEAEIAETPSESLSEAVRYTVLGTVLMEPVLLAIRRLAEARVAQQQFSRGVGPALIRPQADVSSASTC